MNLNQQEVGGTATVDDAAAATRTQSDLPPHLLPLWGGQWALWRTAALRGAGFPATEVLKLSAPETASIADRLVEAEARLREDRAAVIESLESRLSQTTGGERWVLINAIRRIRQEQMPELPEGLDGRQALLERLSLAGDRIEMLAAEFRQSFDASWEGLSPAIRETAVDERFREAVIWQNRAAWHQGIESLLRQKPGAAGRDAGVRKNEELVASYVQRYCVKNDTIGFFGPVGWASLRCQGEAITVRPGPSLLAARRVFLESWGVDALSATLAQNSSLKPWVAPRAMPFIYVQHGTLYLPGGATQKISPQEEAVFQVCDGRRSAKELAAVLLRDPALELKGEDEIYSLLESLRQKGLIAWTLEVPLSYQAERELRKRLDRIGDESVRRDALARLAEFEAARDEVAAAAGDVERLDRALNELELTFSRLTSATPTRAAGQAYAGRTLIYEDCRRDVEVTVGPEILQALERPLGLLLECARWITYEVGERYRRAFQNIYAELVKKTGSPVVSAPELWMKAEAILRRDKRNPAHGVVPELQKRWAEILSPPLEERSVAYTTEQLEQQVRRAFAAPGPGWHGARYHSPDLMIAASGPEAIRRGDYQLVLGELHIGVNSMNSPVFLTQHPRPEELHRAIESDLPRPRLVLVLPRYWRELTARTTFDFVPAQDYRLLMSHDSCSAETPRNLPLGSLVVEAAGEGIIVRTRDNRVRFDIIEGFAERLVEQSINLFDPLPPSRHTPRITIDRLVICREAWRFPLSELDFAFEKDEAARFLAARRWRRAHDLPRFLFVKSKIERKPFYLDLDSPIYVNIFSKVVRRTKESGEANSLLTLTEMIPHHGQAWLPDIKGNRYTSELRLVALDLTHRQASFGL